MSTVRLENITKIFPPNVVAVNNANFKVEKGEFFVLLGPSGCGKTTTLRIIAGLEKPTSGRVYIDEQDVTDLPPRLRDVAMVFQTWALYPHMTVYENIAFPLKLRKLPKDEIDRKVKEVAKLLRIEDLLDRYPKQLSGGQQQRVALARALVRNPRVWLMDEPLSNLDALLRVYMRAELKRLQKELGITTIYVTHDQVEAMSMSDRIVVMNEGKIQQIGTPEEIYRKPSNMFVASFIGTPPMNLIRCVYREDLNALDCPGFRYPLPIEWQEALSARTSDEIVLGVRPEDVEVVEEGEPHLRAKVLVVEPLGKDVVITLALSEDVSIKLVTKPGTGVSMNSVVGLRLPRDKVHIFDAKTGKALI